MNSPALTSLNLGRWTQQFWTNCYFKFVLPRVGRIQLHGIELDISKLPPRIRNRILNVGYEDAERDLCREMLTPEDTVLELGGGIGFLGLFCQVQLGIKHYATVEANPTTVEMLKHNYQLNHLDPIVWNFALGSSNGTVHFETAGDFWEHHVSSDATETGITVPAATLPSLLAQTGFAVSTLIIDIEGAEAQINFNELPSTVKKIIMEVHRENLSEKAVKRLFTNIREQGFHTAHCKDETFGFVRN